MNDHARRERWRALTRYDPEIGPLAESISAFGQKWLDEFESAFFALNEDRSYLGSIASRIISEAEADLQALAARQEAEAQRTRAKAQRIWMDRIQKTREGETTSQAALNILEKAGELGFTITPMENHIIEATRPGLGTTCLYSNAVIIRFGKIHKIFSDN